MWCIRHDKDDLLQIKIETKSTPNWNNIDAKATPKPKQIQSCAPSLLEYKSVKHLHLPRSGKFYKNMLCGAIFTKST